MILIKLRKVELSSLVVPCINVCSLENKFDHSFVLRKSWRYKSILKIPLDDIYFLTSTVSKVELLQKLNFYKIAAAIC